MSIYIHRVATDVYDVYRKLGTSDLWSVVRFYKPTGSNTGLTWTENISRVFVATNAYDGSTGDWTATPGANWIIPRTNWTITGENPIGNLGTPAIVHHNTTQPSSDTSDYAEATLPTGTTPATGMVVMLFSNTDSLTFLHRIEYLVDGEWVKCKGGEWIRRDGSGWLDFPLDGTAQARWFHVDVPPGATKWRLYSPRNAPIGKTLGYAVYLYQTAVPTPCNPGDSGWQRSWGHEIKSRTGSDVFTINIGGTWYGEGHGNEQDLSYTVEVDDVDVTATLAVNDVLAGDEVVVTATTTLKAGTGTSYGTLTKAFNVTAAKYFVDVTWAVENSPSINIFYTGSDTPFSTSARVQNYLSSTMTQIGLDGEWHAIDLSTGSAGTHTATTPVNTCTISGPRWQRSTELGDLVGFTRLSTFTESTPSAKVYFRSNATVDSTVSYRLEHETALIASSRPRAARLSLGLGLGL